uniref:Uncharacterized protein n=1 Tax=Trypanosoma brucei TaxID=5691 RepID=Q582Z7_9TRYP|nr:hypothetical protein, unlikely [Trypanosoma brucei]
MPRHTVAVVVVGVVVGPVGAQSVNVLGLLSFTPVISLIISPLSFFKENNKQKKQKG